MVDAMYKMILKQLWNERKGNLFIWLEMLVVSIFLWYAADALFVMYRLYSQPLGFNIEHTYHVSFGVIPEESPDYDTTSVHSERGGGDYLTLMDRIRRNPSVESICFTTGVHFHYRGSNQYATFRKDSLIRNGFVRFVSPTYFEVFGVKTAEGGSPSELVDALRDNQVVVTALVIAWPTVSVVSTRNNVTASSPVMITPTISWWTRTRWPRRAIGSERA